VKIRVAVGTQLTDPPEPKWLDTNFVLELHKIILDTTGGSAGVRDRNLLESAVNRPINSWLYEGANIFELAAIYAKGICANHALVDCNKRTAMAAAGMFLQYNCYDQKVEVGSEQETLFVDLAQNKISVQQLASWYAANCKHNETCEEAS